MTFRGAKGDGPIGAILTLASPIAANGLGNVYLNRTVRGGKVESMDHRGILRA